MLHIHQRWQYVKRFDLNHVDPLHMKQVHCHTCGSSLRFVYVLKHRRTGERIKVGAKCAESLTGKPYVENVPTCFKYDGSTGTMTVS